MIANSKFDDGGGLHDLNGPLIDVGLMFWALVNPRNGIHEPQNVSVLIDGSADEIRSAIRRVLADTTRHDSVTIYYTGHGSGGADRFFLAGRDTREGRYAETGVSDRQLNALLAAEPPRIALILDCCHSGAFVPDRILASYVYVMASSTENETSPDAEDSSSPSPFTVHLTHALLGAAADSDGAVSIDAAFEYVRNAAGSTRLPGRHNAMRDDMIMAQLNPAATPAFDEAMWRDALESARGLAENGFKVSPTGGLVPQLGLADHEAARLLDLYAIPESARAPAWLLSAWWADDQGDVDSVSQVVDDLARRRALVTVTDEGLQIDPRARRLITVESATRLPDVHRSLIDVARTLLPPDEPHWWRLPDEADYLHRWLPHHLLAAGLLDELDGLVADLRWVAATIRWTGTTAVAEDAAALTRPAADPLRRALARYAHILSCPSNRSGGLAATLISRFAAAGGLESSLTAYLSTIRRALLLPAWPLPDEPHPAQMRVLGQHAGTVRDCLVDSGGGYVVTAGDDGTVRRWSLPSGHALPDLLTAEGEQIQCLALGPDRQWVVAGSTGRVARVLPTDGFADTILLPHQRAVVACAVTADGKWLITGGPEYQPRLWTRFDGGFAESDGSDRSDGGPAALIASVAKRGLRGHSGSVTYCATPRSMDDGVAMPATWRNGLQTYAAATGSEDGTVLLWREGWKSGPRLRTTPVSPVEYCAFVDDTSLLVGHRDGNVRVWDLAGVMPAIRTVLRPGRRIRGGAVHRGRSLFAVGAGDALVQVYGLDGGKRGALSGHHGEVACCAFTPDGGQIVSGGVDGTVRLWSTDGAAASFSRPPHARPASFCAAVQSGWRVLSGGSEGVTWWDADTAVALWSSGSSAICAAPAPDGSWFVSGHNDGRIRITDEGGARSSPAAERPATACTVTPDGQFIIVGYSDGRLRRWLAGDLTGDGDRTLDPRRGKVLACVAHPGPAGVVFATAEGLWRWQDDKAVRLPHGPALCCTVSPDGRWVVSGDRLGTLRVSSAEHGVTALVQEVPAHDGELTGCAVSRDGSLLATVGRDAWTRIWQLDDRGFPAHLTSLRLAEPLRACSWLPDGRRLVLAGVGGTYQMKLTTID